MSLPDVPMHGSKSCLFWGFNMLFFSRRGAENAEISIICRSDFSREHAQFATKVAPTNTCVPLRTLRLCESKY